MTIDEAIKWLERIAVQDEESGRPECVAAEGLGVEALKRIKKQRDFGLLGKWTALPGETEE